MKLGSVIAERRLEVPGEGGRSVVIRIGLPFQHPRGWWVCPYRISGLGRTSTQAASGQDAMQAIQLAFERIRCDLDESGTAVSWLGMDDHGIPRLIINIFGASFSREMSDMIDEEVARRFVPRDE